jgi:hypothetical protein
MRLLSLLILLLLSAPCWPAEPAGRIVHVFGEASALGTDAGVRPLQSGDSVASGETIVTTEGRLQVRFSDGSMMSLRPNTELKVEDYRYTQGDDNRSNAFYELVRGGLRAITGYIGQGRRESFRFTTAVATIGIRGTAFEVWDCRTPCIDIQGREVQKGVHIQTLRGELLVSNDGGDLNLPAGKAAIVLDRAQAPQLSDAPPSITRDTEMQLRERKKRRERIRLAAVAAAQQVAGDETTAESISVAAVKNFIAGEQVDASGVPKLGATSGILAKRDIIVVASSSPDAFNQLGIDVSSETGDFVVVARNGVIVGALRVGPASTQDSDLVTVDLQAMLNTGIPQVTNAVVSLVSSVDPLAIKAFAAKPAKAAGGAAGGLRWGSWRDGRVLEIGGFGPPVRNLAANQAEHFITGIKPSQSLPTSGTATYNFAGGSPSTTAGGNTVGQGVTQGRLLVNFGNSQVGIDMNVRHAANDYTVRGIVPILSGQGANFLFGGSGSATGGSGNCIRGCPARFDGFFAGNGPLAPPQAGLAYGFAESDAIHGVAGFSLQP